MDGPAPFRIDPDKTFRRFGSVSGFTTNPGSRTPSNSSSMFLAARIDIFSLHSIGAAALCGLSTTLGSVSSLLLGSGGSCSCTSSPAASSLPDDSASIRAASSTSGPRAALISQAERFIRPSISRLIMCRVSSPSGQCSVSTSTSGRTAAMSVTGV